MELGQWWGGQPPSIELGSKDLAGRLAKAAADSVAAVSYLLQPEALNFMLDVAGLLAALFSSGGKVLVAGNGGSLCDAAHFAEELTGLFRRPRRALPALVLSEPGHLTCVGNDVGFSEIFARGVQAFGKPGDVFLALTTSGNSENLLLAAKRAKEGKLKVVSLLGKGGGKLLPLSDRWLLIPGATTSDRIQEAHMACLHIIIEGVEEAMGLA